MKKILLSLLLSLSLVISANAASKTYTKNCHTGGTANCLDSIDGDLLAEGDRALVITSDNTYTYYLSASSGVTEYTPQVIAPDDNAGNKRWIMKLVSGDAFYPDNLASDQGDDTVDGNNNTINYYEDTYSANNPTYVLRHNSGSTTTIYTFSTSETITGTLKIEPGAIIAIATGVTLTIAGGPGNIIASKNQQIFYNDGGLVSFSKQGVHYAGWYGIKADWASSGSPGSETDNVTAFHWMLDCLGDGQTVQLDGQYGFDSELTIDQRVYLKGASSVTESTGYWNTSFHFDGTNGAMLSAPFTTIEGIEILGINPTLDITALDPEAYTFGNTGLRNDPAQTISNITINNCRVLGFNTGFLYYKTGPLYPGAYTSIFQSEFRSNNIGVAMVLCTQIDFVSCDFRGNTLHGQYVESSGARFIGGLSEQNGDQSVLGKWNGTYPKRVGTLVTSDGTQSYDAVTFQNHYFERHSKWVKSGNAKFTDCTFADQKRASMGKGGLDINILNKSLNLVPQNIDKYTPYTSANNTITDMTNYYRWQYNGASTDMWLTVTVPINGKVLISDAELMLAGFEFNLATDQSGNAFELYPQVVVTDSSGATAVVNVDLATPTADDLGTWWDYTGGSWDAIQYTYDPVTGLTATNYITEIEFRIRVQGTDFSAVPLDIYLKNPSLTFYTKKPITTHIDEVIGEWTPTISFAGAAAGPITYTTQTGNYTRIGDLVWVNFFITLSSKGTSNGVLRINLPFTNDTALVNGSSVYSNGVSKVVNGIRFDTGVSYCYLVAIDAATITDTEMANNSTISGTIVYRPSKY